MTPDVEAHAATPEEKDGVWKWIAAIFAALLVGGAPGYIRFYLDTPTEVEVGVIRERQDNVLQRLAVLESLHAELKAEIERLREARK